MKKKKNEGRFSPPLWNKPRSRFTRKINFSIYGNPRLPYMVTLDRVTIYRKIHFYFFLSVYLSKLGPLRPIPSG
jgi:hypothetical protein